jgi:hypothetical protein
MTTQQPAEIPVCTSIRATVSVDGHRWRRLVSARALQAAAADAQVFILDPDLGTVRFGDGQHGARPAAGSRVRVTYSQGTGAGRVTATWSSEWPPRAFALAAGLAPVGASTEPCR